MTLTSKDKEFLTKLKQLLEDNDVWVQFKSGPPSRMVLRGTYGQKIHKTFRITRQGVRWRFSRLFNDIYVQAFESVLMIEQTFGTHLRDYAIRISRERYAMHREARRRGRTSSDLGQEP